MIHAIDTTESTLLMALLFFLIVLLGCAVGYLREQWRVYSTLRRLRAFEALADRSRYALRHTVRQVR